MKALRQTIKLIALALVLSPVSMAQDGDAGASKPAVNDFSQFIRVTENEHGEPSALQLAILTYAPRQGDELIIDLVSAIHIADESYYAGLNDRFEGYDVLLYELVTPEGGGVPDRDAERSGFVNSTQVALTQALGLSFQLNEIDYARPNFVHADLSSTELAQSMVDRGDYYVYFWRVVYAVIEDIAADPLGLRDWQLLMGMLSAEGDSSLRTEIAYEMTRVGRLFPDGDSGSGIIGARNERAVQVLEEQLAAGAKHVGIFYGAAHMPDLERRLLKDLGLTHRGTTWVDAWKLGEAVSNQ